MQVLITGGTGIPRQRHRPAPRGPGHSVRLLDVAPDPAAWPPHDAVEIVQGDVMSFGDLGDAMRDVEVVIHLAYSLGEATNRRPYAATRLNVEGTATVLESARLSGVARGDARISLVHVDDVAEQLVRLAGLDAAAFTDRYFFNTGGDATTMRELAALVQEIVPQARIEVTSAGERDVAGLVSRVSGDALAELIGYERRYDLRAGVRAHIEALQQAPQIA